MYSYGLCLQVCHHFQNFMNYDTNNDYTLDLTEVMLCVTYTYIKCASLRL